MFTESAWYRELILRHRGAQNRAPLVLWPYPIDPPPPGPADPARWDLCIYVKNGSFPGLVEQMQARYRQTRVVRYGQYQRRELWEIARHARCCLYLADDDRGPLALAEILLCGCPTVGLPTGAPFVQPGRTGLLLRHADVRACVDAVEDCLEWDRHKVAALAAWQFDTRRIVDTVLGALESARRQAP
ncbi:MAG: glycosyltransferase [Planctomycetota bacterium]